MNDIPPISYSSSEDEFFDATSGKLFSPGVARNERNR